jgi:hypothetical protein
MQYAGGLANLLVRQPVSYKASMGADSQLVVATLSVHGCSSAANQCCSKCPMHWLLIEQVGVKSASRKQSFSPPAGETVCLPASMSGGGCLH